MTVSYRAPRQGFGRKFAPPRQSLQFRDLHLTSVSAESDLASVFPGDGEMARRCRAVDWSKTSLGPTENWSEALRVSVRTTLESPFAINLWCGSDLLLIYNDAYRAVLGAKHPRALATPGRLAWSEIWPDIAPMFEAIRAGQPAVYAEDARFLMERASGPPGEAWFTFALSPIRDENGGIVAFLNVAAETTERIHAQQEAQQARAAAERAERHLREVFAQAPAFMAVLRGPEHRFEFANDAYMRLVGDRDIIGRTVAEALPEVREQGFITLLDDVLRTGEPFVGRELPVMLARTRGAPLEPRHVDFVYQPITDSSGNRSGIVAHGTDVTDAVRARREIEDRESRYRFLTNAIPVQVWTARADGALEYVSDRAARYFGKPAADVVGNQWLSVLHPDDVEPTLARWRQSLTSGEPYEVEFRLWSAEHQEYRWHLGRATAQRDESGQVARWFGTNTDIEESKRTEAELKRLTKEATEANHAKGNFLAAMSHELRTPLNAIGGYAQLIEMGVRGPVTEEQRIDLLKIQRSKNHLDSLVSDVLSFAKLGSGRIEYRLANVKVERAVAAVLEMVTPQLIEKRLRLAPFSAPSDVVVIADEDKLRQILLNLLGNALKFTPAEGQIALHVRVSESDVAIEVCDTGIGIATDQLERVFEPFVQSKRALSEADQGVGLGLAISRQLARAMRGDLTVRSAVGKGSTFTLTLPRARRGGAGESHA